MQRSLILAGVMIAVVAAGAVGGDDPPPTSFECRFAKTPIKIDGKAEDEAWKSAEIIDRFYLPWLKEPRPPRTATKARLLWDREHLYFLAEMEDADLYADITQHDGETWYNDVFELFFKPADDKPGYYEFQVNAAGTVMDMFLPQRGAGGYRRFIADGRFHIEARVSLEGTLNKWQDRDSGWSVEGRIPWGDFVRTGGRPAVGETWKFALCRYDYSVDFEGPDLSTCAPLASLTYPDFHHHEDYARLKFVGPAGVPGRDDSGLAADTAGDARRDPSTRAIRLEQLKAAFRTVPSRVIGSPDPPPPYQVERALPKLKLSFPIFAINEPGSRRIIFIDQERSYGPARIGRTTDDPASGEFETLLEFPASGVGYSLAFHPRFAENGYIYVGWNGAAGGGEKRCFVTRYTLDRNPPYRLDPASALDIIQWPSDGHNGAAVAFGLDGKLYITTGDGTSDSDTNVMGQKMDHLLAKLLRIDVDHPDEGRAYSVPRDNPFVGREGIRPETWAYGFRNPWRMTVDPRTGDIWVGNNGQDLWEQAYLIEPGANYGWSVYEGSHLFYPNRRLGPTPHVKPTLEHPHSEARSLTGGVVYYGNKLPELRGAYIYGDYSTGKIWGARVKDRNVVWHRELADTTLQISAFLLDADGELLVVDHRGDQQGGFYALVPNRTQHVPENFPRTLSETGLFVSVREHRVHPGLIPYTVNAPLWSDGAYKERYLALPAKGTVAIDLSARRGWELPDQTVAVKSFALELEEGRPDSRRWIETRLLTRQEGEWVGYSYLWNDAQTEATLVAKEGADRTFTIRARDGRTREQTWRYPSRTECMVCHSRAANFVLGLSTLQFNAEHDFGGVRANQLEVLEWLGLLRVHWMAEWQAALRDELKQAGMSEPEIDDAVKTRTATRGQRTAPLSTLLFRPPDKLPRLADPYDPRGDLTARARSYLHANCAQCHVEAGGGNAQMQLEFTTPLDKTNLLDVPPLHHKFDLPDARLLAPGDPDRSVLLHRMAIRGRGQMPQLATSQVDLDAVQMLREWIGRLEPAGRK